MKLPSLSSSALVPLLLTLAAAPAWPELAPEAPTPLAVLETGGNVSHYALTSDGKALAISLDHGARIRILDLVNHKWTGELPAHDRPRIMTTNAEAVFTMDPQSGLIQRYNSISLKEEARRIWDLPSVKPVSIAGIPSSPDAPLYVITAVRHLAPLDPLKLSGGAEVVVPEKLPHPRPELTTVDDSQVTWDGASILLRGKDTQLYHLFGTRAAQASSSHDFPALGAHQVKRDSVYRIRPATQERSGWSWNSTRGDARSALSLIPALDGNVTLRTRRKPNGGGTIVPIPFTVELGPLDREIPLGQKYSLPEFALGTFHKNFLPFDRRLVAVTRCNRLITFAKDDKIRIRPLRDESELPFHFNSIAPVRVDRATHLKHAIDLRGGSPPYKLKLADAPAGIEIRESSLDWLVPAEWIPPRISFRIVATDQTGHEIQQGVDLSIGGVPPARATLVTQITDLPRPSLPEPVELAVLKQLGPYIQSFSSKSMNFPAEVSEMVVSEDGGLLVILMEDRRTLQLIDPEEFKLQAKSILLPEAVAGITTVRDQICLHYAETNQLELRPFSDLEKNVRAQLPERHTPVAVGLSLEQPAAPLVVQFEAPDPSAKRPTEKISLLQFLDPQTLKPTRWRLDRGSHIPYEAKRLFNPKFTRKLPALARLAVTPDGRQAKIQGALLHFTGGYRVRLTPTPVSEPSADTSSDSMKLPFGHISKHLVGVDGHFLYYASMLGAFRHDTQANLRILDPETLVPFCHLRGIGLPQKRPHQTEDFALRAQYSAAAKRLFVFRPLTSTLWAIDIDLKKIQDTFPHQTSKTAVFLPESGLLNHRVTFEPADQVTETKLDQAPPGATIDPDSGEITWRAPANTRAGRPILFKITATLKGGHHVSGELAVHKPYLKPER